LTTEFPDAAIVAVSGLSPMGNRCHSRVGGTGAMAAQIDANEVFLTVAEVAERLKLNTETVRRLFLSEPGVVVICFPRRGRRVYRTLRIPERVFQRVVTRFTKIG
jgi:hypothetical protein